LIEHGEVSNVSGLSLYIWLLSGAVAILVAILFRGRGPRIRWIEAVVAVFALLFMPKLGLLHLFFGPSMAELGRIYLGSDPLSMVMMSPTITVSLIAIAKFLADRSVRQTDS